MTEQSVLTKRSLNLAVCGGKRARKKREMTLDLPAFGWRRQATRSATRDQLDNAIRRGPAVPVCRPDRLYADSGRGRSLRCGIVMGRRWHGMNGVCGRRIGRERIGEAFVMGSPVRPSSSAVERVCPHRIPGSRERFSLPPSPDALSPWPRSWRSRCRICHA